MSENTENKLTFELQGNPYWNFIKTYALSRLPLLFMPALVLFFWTVLYFSILLLICVLVISPILAILGININAEQFGWLHFFNLFIGIAFFLLSHKVAIYIFIAAAVWIVAYGYFYQKPIKAISIENKLVTFVMDDVKLNQSYETEKIIIMQYLGLVFIGKKTEIYDITPDEFPSDMVFRKSTLSEKDWQNLYQVLNNNGTVELKISWLKFFVLKGMMMFAQASFPF